MEGGGPASGWLRLHPLLEEIEWRPQARCKRLGPEARAASAANDPPPARSSDLAAGALGVRSSVHKSSEDKPIAGPQSALGRG